MAASLYDKHHYHINKKVLFSLILSNKKTKCRNLLNFYFISEHPYFRVYCLYLRMYTCQHKQNILQNWQSKPSRKLGQQSAICWNSLGLFRDYGLNYICFLEKKLFCFSRQKAEDFNICLKKNFVKRHKISTHSDNYYFHFFYRLSD